VAGGVHHRQEQRWAGKEAEAAAQQEQAAAQQTSYENQAQLEEQQQQMAAMQQQMAAMQAQQAQAAIQAQTAPPPAAAPAGSDLTAQLNQLAQLKASGVLTEEEFAAAKAKLLSGG
jgi:hypothetical protein